MAVKNSRYLLIIITAISTFGGINTNTGPALELDNDMIITPKGYGSFEIGQVVHGYFRGGSKQFEQEIEKIWQQRAFGNLGLTAKYKEILEIDITGEGMMAFSNPQVGDYPETMQPRNFFYMKSANALIKIGDPHSWSGNFQIGYFPYKYNSNVRNLGEYLFRSLPYPLVIYSEFDYPQVALLGLRLNAQYSDSLLCNDFLIHSETVAHPIQNWSISDVVTSHFFNTFTVGVGVSLFSNISVYEGKNISYAGIVDNYYALDSLERATLGIDPDFEYQAVKIMLQGAVDIKQIFRLYPIVPFSKFGNDDFKLYGELDILGLKNYDTYYGQIKDRMIWVFGLNIPGFKIIDLINTEVEFCENGTAYSDAFFYNKFPKPEPCSLGVDPNSSEGIRLSREKWRWSFYLKKSFFNQHLNVTLQCARDHKKINGYYFVREFLSFQETLPTKKDWWWVFKTEFKF